MARPCINDQCANTRSLASAADRRVRGIRLALRSGEPLEADGGDRRQQRILVGEMPIRRHGRDAGAAGRLAEAEAACVPAFGEDRQPGFDERAMQIAMVIGGFRRTQC